MKKNKFSNNLTKPIRTENNNGFSFTEEHVKKWAENGLMPVELANAFFDRLARSRKEFLYFNEYRKNNPTASNEEIVKNIFNVPEAFASEHLRKIHEDIEHVVKFQKFLEENWTELEDCFSNENVTQLYKNINPSTQFGISNVIANSLFHLRSLLDNMKVKQLGECIYEAEGTVINSIGESISLVYSFQSSSLNESSKIFGEYKKIMVSKGLKILLAHWLMANKKGRPEYQSSMTDIMSLMIDDERKTFFSVKEKEEHWAITKILNMSKLKRTRKIKKRGTNKEIEQWIEQPLVEILGGEKELTVNEKYPTTLIVRVLPPIDNASEFAPHAYNNSTVKLSPSDTNLAFKLQTRAAQMGRGEKNLNVDWDYMFREGNLQNTADSKKSVAKSQARKKLKRLQENKIIEGWNEEKKGIRIKPIKFKKKKAD